MTIIAVYKLNNGALTTDSSGNGYTLTNIGSVVNDAGTENSGAKFSGNNGLRIVNGLGYTNGIDPISFSCSVYWTAFPGTSDFVYIFNKMIGTTTGSQWQLRISDNGTSIYCSKDGYTGNTSYTFSLNKWYEVYFTYNGTTLKVWVDGKIINTFTQTGTLNYSSYSSEHTLGVGRLGNYKYMSGKLDECIIYNIGNSDAYMKNIYTYRKGFF